ncbi:DUF6457 domain-containing protein [Rothia endophytica]|uniref:DUF6457 domain-containing protein n=1 Tax=Rothia endophytica TaxID=1324766 RepID=UPI001F1AAC9A|nr:DUF6457 domain-containing protein [Rothia endophytica]
MSERNPQDLVLAREFVQEVAQRLDLDPQVIQQTLPHLLGLTKHVAHGVVRPAAPLAAFLVGLAAGQNSSLAGSEVDTEQLAAGVLAHIAAVEELVKEHKNGQA